MLKLEQNGISRNLLMILQGHLNERKGSVVLKFQLCFWASVTAEVPLVQSLIQCSFSSALMIYQKVSLDGTNSTFI